MTSTPLIDLQASVQNRGTFQELTNFKVICQAFLEYLQQMRPTRIIFPSHPNYIFYQYGADHHNRITRPLNTNLFIESPIHFTQVFESFRAFLADLKISDGSAAQSTRYRSYVQSKEVNRTVYTIQQSIGCIGDSFENQNQSRKRVGQLFEVLIKLILQEVGAACESRTINLPIPGHPGYVMGYPLDLVFSRDRAIIASETRDLHPSEVVGSVKTTSKDRIDKIFLDKHLLTKLLGRDIRVVAIFLHDVQRARRGNSIFGVNSTFKTNHFLGYTVALNRLDGVYYVDPRPEMLTMERLREQIADFQRFIVNDLWVLANRQS